MIFLARISYFFLSALAICQSYVYANEPIESWTSYWQCAVNYSANQEHSNALENYSLAIAFFEKSEDVPLFLFNERALSFMQMGNLEQAKADFSMVIESYEKKPSTQNLHQVLQALWGRTAIYKTLGLQEYAIADYIKISNLDPDFPVVEFDSHVLIIKNLNLENDAEAKLAFITALINIGICEKPENISFSSSGIYIIQVTKAYASAVQKSHPSCKECPGYKWMPKLQDATLKNNPRKIIECQQWCDKVAISVGLGCAYCPTPAGKSACVAAVASLKEGCHWCCSGGNFYEKCISPLKVFYPKDPAWDNPDLPDRDLNDKDLIWDDRDLVYDWDDI